VLISEGLSVQKTPSKRAFGDQEPKFLYIGDSVAERSHFELSSDFQRQSDSG